MSYKCRDREGHWEEIVWLMKWLPPLYTGGFYDEMNAILNQMSSLLHVIGKTSEIIQKYLPKMCPSEG